MRATVAMEPQAWQQVVNLLAEAPFKVSAPLILEIQRQLSPQLGPPVASRQNGEAVAPEIAS